MIREYTTFAARKQALLVWAAKFLKADAQVLIEYATIPIVAPRIHNHEYFLRLPMAHALSKILYINPASD